MEAEQFELKIKADGTIETIYRDGLEAFAKDIGGEVAQVCRLSNVEWESNERGLKGWSVRSANAPDMALRYAYPHAGHPPWDVSSTGRVVLFETREAALAEEAKFVWELRGKPDGKED